MRTLIAVLILAVLIVVPVMAGRSHTVSRTHIVDNTDDVEFLLVKDTDGDYYAEYERDGVRYRTTHTSVLAQLEDALEAHRELSDEHARLGRQHADLGREHADLGREHARLGREHSRLARDGESADTERRRRDLETEQRGLEAKQRKLEDRQRALESEQRTLETRQRGAEKTKYRAIEAIFVKAAGEGKAEKK